jgi:hypothetical protein
MGEKFGQNYAKKVVPLSLFYKELYSFFYGTLIFTDFKYHKIQFVPQNSFIPMNKFDNPPSLASYKFEVSWTTNKECSETQRIIFSCMKHVVYGGNILT